MSIKKIQKESNTNKIKKTKAILIRAPESYLKDLKEISHLTGLSVNAVCLELLRIGIKERLRELIDKK